MSTKINSENPISGVVTTRKCFDCGHHEVGLTTATGDFVAFRPGMQATLESKTAAAKTKGELANEKFNQGFNCAQSVLFAFAEDLRFDPETALKLACGMGAGMGRKQEICGAVSGGILAIGLKYGKSAEKDKQATQTTYAKTRTLMERFEKAHGSIVCRQLLDGCDLMTEQGQKRFKDEGLLKKTCRPSVQTVVNILEEIL